MTRHQKIAAKAIEAYLQEHRDRPVIPLYTLSVVADRSTREAGRKSDLFDSLSLYDRVLPPGCRTQWTDGFLQAVNPFGPPPPPAEKFVPGPFDVATDA